MKNILLIGTGRFGRHIAVQLSQLGHQVMAVDTNSMMCFHMSPTRKLETAQAQNFFAPLASEILMSAL